MSHRPLTTLAALACAAILAACTNGGPAASRTVEPTQPASTPAATQATEEPTTGATETPVTSPEPTVEEEEPAAGQGDAIQATYEAMVASQPGHPLLRSLMVMGGSLQATFTTDPATGGTVTVDAPVGGEPVENPYGSELPPAPTAPAAGLEVGEHWDAAQSLRPECTELMAEVSVLHTGVTASRYRCGFEEEAPVHVAIGEEGFAVEDDYFSDEGVAQAMAMAQAAGVEDANAIMWEQALGPQLTVPGPSVPLTDGQTCSWTFVPALAGSMCFEAEVTHSFPLSAWADSLPAVLETALPLVEADGGFWLDPAFGIEIDEVTGEPVATFISATQEFYEFGADGTRL